MNLRLVFCPPRKIWWTNGGQNQLWWTRIAILCQLMLSFPAFVSQSRKFHEDKIREHHPDHIRSFRCSFGADNRGRTCTVAHQILSLARLPISPYPRSDLRVFARKSELSPWDYLFMPSATATAQATVAPTMGLLPRHTRRRLLLYTSFIMPIFHDVLTNNHGLLNGKMLSLTY